jgi:hypothetical protein
LIEVKPARDQCRLENKRYSDASTWPRSSDG